MIRLIDSFLNKITMYRLVLYELIFLLVAAGVLGIFGFLPYSLVELLYSIVFILAVTFLINTIFEKTFDAPSNTESTYITALILALIITPPNSFSDLNFLSLALWAGTLAVASKYIIAIGKKHILNPAAIGIAITAFTVGESASWWIGSRILLPFVLIGGILIVRKLRRFDLFASFSITAILTVVFFTIISGGSSVNYIWKIILDTPLLFFATVMLTEPMTTPPTRPLQIIYGILVGFLFAPQIHLGSIYGTPELALILGNIFVYFVSPKTKYILTLKEKKLLAANTYEFIFNTNKKMEFVPGQYMEWTLAHEREDSRGMRRYFTLASSPTENEVRVGVKFYPEASTFKNKLLSLSPGDSIVASQLAGDFTLPKDINKKLVFIAGGIGVTPFRSMIKYALDQKESRPIIQLYSNRTPEDVAYRDLFDEVEHKLDIRTLYAFSDNITLPEDKNVRGKIDASLIKSDIPDYLERIFYISGPQAMVVSFEQLLKQLGIPKNHIKKDYFPGFA